MAIKNSEKEQPLKVRTKLKFVKSDQTGAIVSFVSQNPKTGRICGVRQDSPYPKKIVLLDKNLTSYVLLNTLYDVVLIPMSERNGYVAIEITPVQFKATISTTYVRKCIYKVEVSFGNKVITFDPFDGKKESIRNLAACRSVLEKRVDIMDINQVVEDFQAAASSLLRQMDADGYVGRRFR